MSRKSASLKVPTSIIVCWVYIEPRPSCDCQCSARSGVCDHARPGERLCNLDETELVTACFSGRTIAEMRIATATECWRRDKETMGKQEEKGSPTLTIGRCFLGDGFWARGL